MKRIMTFAFALTIAAALALTTTSCTNDDNLTLNDQTTNGVQVTVSASIDDDATTRSEVVESTDANGKKHTLKFTAGDRLYVYGEIDASTSVAGYLTMVGSPTNSNKSATFTGTVKAYDISDATPVETSMPAGEDPLALCTHKATKATLVHKDMNTNAISITEGKDVSLYPAYMNAADVNTLMTTSLPVQGDYNSSNKSFALSSTRPIINCTLSGFEANSEHEVGLYYEDTSWWTQSFRNTFTADANGVISVAFASMYSGSKNWKLSIKFSSVYYDIPLGTQNLTAKVYNINRWWVGNRFVKLNGKFTINANGDQVYFAPGNLQAVCTSADSDPNTQETWTWGIAANQWDYVGNAAANTSINGNGSVSAAGTVDLFGWVGESSTLTGAAQYGISKSNTTYDGYGSVAGESLKSDWGNTIGKGWRTLTSDEWAYLLNTRAASTVNSTENARYAKATVNNVSGLILFPDSYTHPDGVYPTFKINEADKYFYNNVYSGDDWLSMENAGAVFLPAAGIREGSSVSAVNSSGRYWTSTSTSNAYYIDSYLLYIYDTTLDPKRDLNRFYGSSVRLAYPAN